MSRDTSFRWRIAIFCVVFLTGVSLLNFKGSSPFVSIANTAGEMLEEGVLNEGSSAAVSSKDPASEQLHQVVGRSRSALREHDSPPPPSTAPSSNERGDNTKTLRHAAKSKSTRQSDTDLLEEGISALVADSEGGGSNSDGIIEKKLTQFATEKSAKSQEMKGREERIKQMRKEPFDDKFISRFLDGECMSQSGKTKPSSPDSATTTTPPPLKSQKNPFSYESQLSKGNESLPASYMSCAWGKFLDEWKQKRQSDDDGATPSSPSGLDEDNEIRVVFVGTSFARYLAYGFSASLADGGLVDRSTTPLIPANEKLLMYEWPMPECGQPWTQQFESDFFGPKNSSSSSSSPSSASSKTTAPIQLVPPNKWCTRPKKGGADNTEEERKGPKFKLYFYFHTHFSRDAYSIDTIANELRPDFVFVARGAWDTMHLKTRPPALFVEELSNGLVHLQNKIAAASLATEKKMMKKKMKKRGDETEPLKKRRAPRTIVYGMHRMFAVYMGKECDGYEVIKAMTNVEIVEAIKKSNKELSKKSSDSGDATAATGTIGYFNAYEVSKFFLQKNKDDNVHIHGNQLQIVVAALIKELTEDLRSQGGKNKKATQDPSTAPNGSDAGGKPLASFPPDDALNPFFQQGKGRLERNRTRLSPKTSETMIAYRELKSLAESKTESFLEYGQYLPQEVLDKMDKGHHRGKICHMKYHKDDQLGMTEMVKAARSVFHRAQRLVNESSENDDEKSTLQQRTAAKQLSLLNKCSVLLFRTQYLHDPLRLESNRKFLRPLLHSPVGGDPGKKNDGAKSMPMAESIKQMLSSKLLSFSPQEMENYWKKIQQQKEDDEDVEFWKSRPIFSIKEHVVLKAATFCLQVADDTSDAFYLEEVVPAVLKGRYPFSIFNALQFMDLNTSAADHLHDTKTRKTKLLSFLGALLLQHVHHVSRSDRVIMAYTAACEMAVLIERHMRLGGKARRAAEKMTQGGWFGTRFKKFRNYLSILPSEMKFWPYLDDDDESRTLDDVWKRASVFR